MIPESGKRRWRLRRRVSYCGRTRRRPCLDHQTGSEDRQKLDPTPNPAFLLAGQFYVTPFLRGERAFGPLNNKRPDMSVDYFDVGVGNFGTSHEHEDQNANYLTGCGRMLLQPEPFK
jgi:hypothetical protein